MRDNITMAINDELVYEVNEKGENVLVKSINSDHQAYLRFTNLTSRAVDVWWRDFAGKKRFYERMEPGAFYDINSYLTHPWEFTDATTGEHYVINNKLVFRAPERAGDLRYRTNWNITVPVRTLKSTAMQTLASLLPHPDAASELDLPNVLSRELAELVTRMRRAPAVEEPAENTW